MRKQYLFTNGWEFALERGFHAGAKKTADSLKYEPVMLPHDWMRTSPFNRQMEQGEAQGFFDRWGCGWYRKSFFLKEKEACIYRLCFDGIYERSTIWVNDRKVGGRNYGYSSFCVDITDALQTGMNRIIVRADNTGMPADRWYSGAGIYRKVTMEVLPAVHLEPDNIQVLTEICGDTARLTVHTGLRETVRAVLDGFGQHTEECGSEEIILTLEHPRLWSAEHPDLYALTLQLLSEDTQEPTDEITIKTGIRTVTLSPETGLSVNGTPVKLKGMCIHQDAGCFGTAVQPEIWRERLLRVKQIGCNALRLAHHLFMPEILDLCDELGFYVYEECFDKWTGGSYGRFYEEDWEADIACMVKRDRNRPSVLFWGVGNEVENQAYDSMLRLLRRHVETVKQYDPARPVSVAMNPHFAYPAPEVDMSQVKDIQQFVDEMKTGEIFDVDERIVQIEKIAQEVDLLCCNYQEQWYEKIHRAIPDKAILGTETYMYFRGMEDKFQNFSDENPWFDVEKLDYCIGGFIWTGIDYLGESMGYPAKGWSGALFALDMEPRPIAKQYQSYWTKEPMVDFAVMDYSVPDTGTKEHWDYPHYESHWEFPQFQKTVIPYRIATNCEEAEIQVNEKQFLLKPTDTYPNYVITGYLPYLKGTVTVIGKRNGREMCRQVLQTPGIAVALAFGQEEQSVLLSVKRVLTEKGEEVMPVPMQLLLKVRAYDENGNPVFRESAKVTFAVEGPARLIGVENGDIKTAEAFDNDFVHLFQGRADAGILITGEGRIRVTAYAGGMRMAQTVITAACAY